jgi:RNA polymerase sigma-70 factor (ECF subfamily)
MQQPEARVSPTAAHLTLYDQHAPAILSYLCQHLSHVQDAEDVLVEVFLAALNKTGFETLNSDHQQAWLKRVAHNKLVDRLRKTTRLQVTSLDEALEQESRDLSPEDLSVQRESYAHLYRCLARLSPEQQELIQLRYGEGLRLVEIADLLHRPDGTVRKQLLRALDRLRTLYHQSAREKGN